LAKIWVCFFQLYCKNLPEEKNIVNGEDSGAILGAADCLIPFGSPVKSRLLAVSVPILLRNSVSISSSS